MTDVERPPAGWYPDSTGGTRWWDGDRWTEHQPPPATQTSQPPVQAGVPIEPKKKRRVFLWFFLLVQLLFIVWIVAGASSGAGTPEDCGELSAEACNAASDVGTSIGVALLVVVWVVVDFLLAVIYGVYRLAKR